MEGEIYLGRKFRTGFTGKSFELEDDMVEEFLEACRILDSEGMAPGNAGNVSLRTEEGMLIKAGGVSLGDLTREGIILVVDYEQETNTAKVKGRSEPSSETPMHWLIYRSFPEVKAIVHAHDPLVLENPGLVERLGIETTAREIPYGTFELAGEVVSALKKSRYILIKKHGSLAVGENLADAMNLMLKVHRKFKDESKD